MKKIKAWRAAQGFTPATAGEARHRIRQLESQVEVLTAERDTAREELAALTAEIWRDEEEEKREEGERGNGMLSETVLRGSEEVFK